MKEIIFKLLIVCVVVIASYQALSEGVEKYGSYVLKKEGVGTGSVCVVGSEKAKTCKKDEADQEDGCKVGDTLKILAVPDKISGFKGWDGACNSDSKLCFLECRNDFGTFEAIAHFDKRKKK